MKRISIVPFTIGEYPLLDFLKTRYTISSLISPKGIGLEGQDVSILKNEPETGYKFTNSTECGLAGADIVIVSAISKKNLQLYHFAIGALKCAIELGKEIYCFLDFDGETIQKRSILTDCKKHNAKCHFFPCSNRISDDLLGNVELYKFGAPVLYIHEMVPNCDGYSIFLKLAFRFREAGKRVLAISEDCYNPLFDMIYTSFDSKIPLSEQVFHLNRLTYGFYRDLHPDIILIRLTNPLIRYDNRSVYDSGLTAFALSQAVPGDGSIYCSLQGSSGREFWDGMGNAIGAKFGYPVLAVHVSNCILDPSSNTSGRIVCIPKNSDKTGLRAYQSESLQFYRMLEQTEFEKAFEMIVEEFFCLPYGVI